jgi:hypothetical protein
LVLAVMAHMHFAWTPATLMALCPLGRPEGQSLPGDVAISCYPSYWEARTVEWFELGNTATSDAILWWPHIWAPMLRSA